MMTALIVVGVLVVVVGIIAFTAWLQESVDGVLCPSCGHRAEQHSYFPVEKGWEFAASLHRCEARHPEHDGDGTDRLVRCDCTLSQAEVRFNAEKARAA